MTTLTNYMTVNQGSNAVPPEKAPDPKEVTGSAVYPALGILGIAYLIYLLISSWGG